MHQITLFNLERKFSSLKKQFQIKLDEMIDQHHYTFGAETQLFEKKFANFSQCKYALAVNSGTTSLLLVLLAAGIKFGDEVITTPLTFSATADAIALVGAKPVFADVEIKTGNLDPKKVEAKINKKTKAILLVHFYGVPADMDKFSKLAKKYKLLLIEDASHAHGSTFADKKVGSFGLAGCFSLYPTKTIGAMGNVGVITTNSNKFFKQLTMEANHGIADLKNKYLHNLIGLNGLMNNFQAAILNLQFKNLPKLINKKRQIANGYNQIFKKYNNQGMFWPQISSPSLYVYAVLVKNRNQFIKHMHGKHIQTGIYYPTPLHLQPSYSYLGYQNGNLPNAERIASATISIPANAYLTKQEINYIIQAIKEYYVR